MMDKNELGDYHIYTLNEKHDLGAKENITSPTFSIVNQYLISNRLINHFDLYRIKSLTELDVIGFDEYLESGAVCFIEWPEKIHNLLPSKFVRVGIKVKNNLRKITVST